MSRFKIVKIHFSERSSNLRGNTLLSESGFVIVRVVIEHTIEDNDCQEEVRAIIITLIR